MHWTIRKRLFCLVALMLVSMLALGISGRNGLDGAKTGLQDVLLTSRVLRNHLEGDMMHDALRADVLASILAQTESQWQEAAQELEDHIGHFRNSLQANKALQQDAATRAALDEVGPALEQYIASAQNIVEKAHADKQQAEQMLPRFLESFDELEGRMSSVSDRIEQGAQDAEKTAQRRIDSSLAIQGIMILIAAIIAAACAMLVIRSILAGIHRLVEALQPMSEGKLGREIRVTSNDEFGKLLQSMRAMDRKLHSIVGRVRATSETIGTAARELSQGNDDLNERTQEQAAALQETSASMEEMATSVKQNADNARLANHLAAGARDQAVEGGTVVEQAINAMQEINASSRRIADIIGVIDEIAFQTNLLALNAAVEAARAGEQGRGFAVVASEVRSLAQRSASAAKEIKTLIGDSVEKVKTGSGLVDDSGKTISGIMDSIKKVTDIVAEIAASCEEQASGVEQVNRAIAQLDQVTQQNAALVEQAAAASKSMEQQTALLTSDVGFFNCKGTVQSSSPPQVPATPARPEATLPQAA